MPIMIEQSADREIAKVIRNFKKKWARRTTTGGIRKLTSLRTTKREIHTEAKIPILLG